ncbi:MAG: HAMP domain-containing protein, partial [Planctomycetes bacterium]|nr:HAMP domain-containing protein [Planctomycetota bacterium]
MRGPGRLFWKLFLGSLLLTAAVLAVCAWLISRETESFTQAALVQHLRGQALLLREMVGERLDAAHAVELDRLAKDIASRSPHPVRITFILPDGLVLGDSQADPARMESHANRREVIAALKDGWGDEVHLSHTLSMDMRYVAARVGPAEAPLGVVRVAMSTEAMGAKAKVLGNLVWQICLVGAAGMVVFAMGLAKVWSEPIKQMTATARSLSHGDLSARIHVSGHDEVADLGRSLNQMRDHLAAQLETIDRQRQILESLLTQLLEGVVVVGSDGRIVLINPAAIRLLGLPGDVEPPAVGFKQMHVEDFISHPQLRGMLLSHQRADGRGDGGAGEDGTDRSQTPAGGASRLKEARIRVQTCEGEISLLARALDVRLPNLGDGPAGEAEGRSSVARLMVLTDVTELSRAMQVKTDFAANASHELRTPLSAILGAVETLMEMDLAREAAAAQQFVQMVQRHADRMQA